MLQQLSKKRKGAFTLVEIMIVVAIIALLAAMATPSLLRARKQTQATSIKEELRLLEHAKDQWATEQNKKGTDKVLFTDVQKHLKSGSRLEQSGGKDLIGNVFSFSTVDTPVKLDPATVTEFEDIIPAAESMKFWGLHDPANKPAESGSTEE